MIPRMVYFFWSLEPEIFWRSRLLAFDRESFVVIDSLYKSIIKITLGNTGINYLPQLMKTFSWINSGIIALPSHPSVFWFHQHKLHELFVPTNMYTPQKPTILGTITYPWPTHFWIWFSEICDRSLEGKSWTPQKCFVLDFGEWLPGIHFVKSESPPVLNFAYMYSRQK